MKLSELIEKLDALLPKTLSEEWDNDGNMLVVDKGCDVEKIVTTLDLTPACVEEAVRLGAQLIISHHPFIFKPLSNLDEGLKTSLVKTLITSGISVLSYHTRFDKAQGGMNDALAEKLGLINPEPLLDMARLGFLPKALSPEEFSSYVSKKLDCDLILYSAHRPVSKVAVIGGGGKDFVLPARLAKADAIVTGDVSHSVVVDEVGEGITVIDAGHFGTEKIFPDAFIPFLEKAGFDTGKVYPFRACDMKTFVLKES